MPTRSCENEPKQIAQTLFLGASVASFSNNVGWGSQPSQLTVNLIEDDFAYGCGNPPNAPIQNRQQMYTQFARGSATDHRLRGFSDNHYHTCQGDSCYVDKFTGSTVNDRTPIENKILPGKVYYKLTENNGLVSRYWSGPDPGFFGKKTRMLHTGVYNSQPEDNHPNLAYDIIDTPVYFKMGDFQFGGFVQSWSNSISSGGKNFTVTVNGPQAILNSCYVIVDKFAGTIFSKSANAATATNIYGSPKNYLGSLGVDYTITDIYKGVLPNVFNVYGFLESFGMNNFGVARPNENGVSINKVLEALSILTSVTRLSTHKLDSVLRAEHAPKIAFSPFGRIISKCMQREDFRTNANPPNSLYTQITSNFNEFGVIYPQPLHAKANNRDNAHRCQFILDINELLYDNVIGGPKRMPDDIRIPGPVISIMELINIVAEQTGQDVYIDMIPTVISGILYHCIKVKTISRLQQPRNNAIDSTIKLLQCNGYPISSNTVGKEKNETPSRALIIGGQQQRLLQVSSYRLAYTQNSFIYDPRNKRFINYYSLKGGPMVGNGLPSLNLTDMYGHGKVRFPNFGSTRNTFVSDTISSINRLEAYYTEIIKDEQKIQENIGKQWSNTDNTWNTVAELKDGVPVQYGNYNHSEKFNHNVMIDSASGGRWFPLYLDTICPFFGFVHDEEITLNVRANSTDSNTAYRQVRPVWFDTWTGQIAIIIRVDELPTLSLPLTRQYLGTSSLPPALAVQQNQFPLPYLINLPNPAPNTSYNNKGLNTAYNPIEYFVITESEIRAALAGFDNFLVYSLAKTYKTDLMEMVRRAYAIETRDKLVNLGLSPQDASQQAVQETDWYWKLLGSNIAGDELYPTIVAPDKTDGSQYIQEKALQDLRLIHGFISEVGKYYGKKYMVYPGSHLDAYRDESLANIAFPTNVGYGYVFAGDGKIAYNYTPTNDGAWEEYGNIIDDSIVVGGTQWYNLSDDQGKIRPLLGYNNNYQFDYIRHAKCEASKSTNFITDFAKDGANPYFSYSAWQTLLEHKRGNCNNSFVFPSLDLASLSSTDYVIIDQLYNNSNTTVSIPRNFIPTPGLQTQNLPSLTLGAQVKSYDAWGNMLVGGNEFTNNFTPLTRSKLYVSTSVDEEYIFLDTARLLGARILIDSPGVFLNASSTEYAKDPNRTVIANVAAEDLIVYMKTTSSWDWNWIRYMLNYISPATYGDDDANPHILGLYSISANGAANNVELSPKAAHPFFAGIPIKSNQFVYGPWTNYPYTDYNNIFPTGLNVSQSSSIPPVCTDVAVHKPDADEASRALDNLITSVDIEVKDDFVPWNYGGMHYLDMVAFKEIETKINYQSVIETAQVDMPGLPIFGLGDSFALSSIAGAHSPYTLSLVYRDVKPTSYNLPDLSYIPGAQVVLDAPSYDTVRFTYIVGGVRGVARPIGGPIISSVQCSVGQNGISTSYNFRTYTRKIGLYNKEESDRIKKLNAINLKRNKQMSQISQEIANISRQQQKNILEEKLNKAQFGSADLSSKLFGWSPSMVLIGQAAPYIEEPLRTPKYIEDFSFNSTTTPFNSRPGAATQWQLPFGLDSGDSILEKNSNYLTTNTSIPALKNSGRIVTTVQLYERKEVGAQLDKNYGTQSAMSLDGLLSPVSFYPTYKNATFSYSLHNTENCPFCNGTKIRRMKIVQYDSGGQKQLVNGNNGVFIVCDKCGTPGDKLNAKIQTNNEEIPINLITLNPIVVAYGEFKNPNTQNYSGAHPRGAHADISSASPGLGGQIRHFRDRQRHCIEIVARGSVPQNQTKYALETSKNLAAYNKHIHGLPKYNSDYDRYDRQLFMKRLKVGDSNNRLHENNQRFFGLRGPLVLHSWGYDEEGYPVPNAADEPYAIDQFGRPKRFKLRLNVAFTTKKYKTLSNGQMFKLETGDNSPVFSKTFNNQNVPHTWYSLPISVINEIPVYVVTLEDDLTNEGGFDPGDGETLDYLAGYKGGVISKTQRYVNGRWTEKVKLNEFYLNWAERPDLWRVGPIDLTWDEDRRVWTGGQGCGEESPPFILTNANDIDTIDAFLKFKKETDCPYRNIYATLEEDLIKQPDNDDTYAARAFIDDAEFSKEPLQQGYRRLVYIKDKCGYSAPKGTKLLCRYNKYTGFYEPLSKPTLVAKGLLNGGNQATIYMHYVQGRRAGVVPTSTVTFDNPLGFSTGASSVAIFTFLNGKWTLTSIKQ